MRSDVERGALHTRQVGDADVSAQAPLLDALADVLTAHGTLYAWAAEQTQPQALRGRAPVYVATVPARDGWPGETLVVRHAWHGGLLAPLTGDRFVRPTRAPHEYEMSRRLRAAGIPTTAVLGFARYPAFLGLCTVDVVSQFVPDATDLGAVAAGLVPDIACDEALAATHTLLVQLAAHRVVHPDLNVKNILLTRGTHRQLTAMVIDVDVIQWQDSRTPQDTMAANVARLARSMRKWRTHFGCDVTDSRLQQFTSEALAVTPATFSAVVSR